MEQDKQEELLNDIRGMKGRGTSNCCGWGTYGELLICEHCGEHCEVDLRNVEFVEGAGLIRINHKIKNETNK